MLEIRVTLLTGRYVATSTTDRAAAEWPPHPARLFSALVATWADDDEPSGDERAVLEWLEQLEAPMIEASADPAWRTPVIHYVPVNDASVVGLSETERRAAKIVELDSQLDELASDTSSAADKARSRLAVQRVKQLDVSSKVTDPGKTNVGSVLELLPSGRNKQARIWPSVTPASPIVTFRWPGVQPSLRTLETLDSLCGRVSRVGHSSSLVSIVATEVAELSGRAGSDLETTDMVWRPVSGGAHNVRWVQPGQLAALEAAFAEHQGSRPRTLPQTGFDYAQPGGPTPERETPAKLSSLSGRTYVFAFDSNDRVFPATRAVEFGTQLRDAVHSHTDGPSRIVSGHEADGAVTSRSHASFVSLPFVAHAHATGLVMGMAVVLPSSIEAVEEREIEAALARWQRAGGTIRDRKGRVMKLLRADDDRLDSLRVSAWSRPSRIWTSVTPIALPRHPGHLRAKSPVKAAQAWERANDAVALSCEHAGLTGPVRVELSLQPLLRGSIAATKYPALRQPHRGGGQTRSRSRQLVHATVEFDEPVAGPLLLGTGRYLGLGLMRPLEEIHENGATS